MIKLFAVLLPFAWLLPNHYPPWLSAWQDGWALAMLALGLLFLRSRPVVPLPWLLALGLAGSSVMLQQGLGLLPFSGDAVMVALYLAATAGAIVWGRELVSATTQPAWDGVCAFAAGILVAATLSVGIALVQWTQVFSLGIYGVEMPALGRPFGNLAQANHLSTVTFLGLCALAVLREQGRFSAVGFAFAGLFLILGMAATVSRTAWVQWLLLLAAMTWVARGNGARGQVRWLHVVAGGGAFALLTACWPAINAGLALDEGRPPLASIEGGNGRLPLWGALLQAVGRSPLGGYGWLQTSQAQAAASADLPPLHAHYEYSHNLLIDLMVWVGVPLAVVLIALMAWGFLQLWVKAAHEPDRRAFWLFMMVLAFGAHAMLEMPHAYAYFLLPVGVAIGAVHALGRAPARLMKFQAVWASLVLGALGLLGVIAGDYLSAEQSHRLLRLESAKIGDRTSSSTAPELRVLDQLESFLLFARTPPSPAMTGAQMELMRRVSDRYAYPSVMYRYALAAGLNGQPDSAERMLRALCSMHTPRRCDEAREAWQAAQLRYPALASIRFPGP
ncbi:PglL family O-oligosaccharyltransferase [Rubrivivax rivuli]|uniref:Virulence factor membrane-bound polymerase C-terminal domain-containing protein n=1 Tax=Rubrivivax rivuli TaxID=1862385 RepID=A0A437RQR4_9BURK|nr:O-antigen ligase family protein [Rubrivivax rivuli]RVU49129.1 hypothetical protein EOE66_00635 [Rubrivivax rivuli]